MLYKLLTGIILIGCGYLALQGWERLKESQHFPLEKIQIQGLVNVSHDTALKTMGVTKGTNLLTIDPKKIRSRLLSLSWIHSVRVKRIFPSTLTISLIEKNAVCLSKLENRIMVMDEYGMPIKPLESQDPLLLPVVTPADGTNQASNVVWMINLLDKQAWIKDQISEAIGQAGGRWTLYTKKGVKLLLSNRAEQELSLLHRLQKRYKILDLSIRQIELRIANRVAVRPEAPMETSKPEKKARKVTPIT